MLMTFVAILGGLQISHATPPGAEDSCSDVGEYDLYGNEGFCVVQQRCDASHPCGDNEECTEGVRLCMKAPDDFDMTNPSRSYGACSASGYCLGERICVEASRCLPRAVPVNVEALETPAPPETVVPPVTLSPPGESVPEGSPPEEWSDRGRWAWIVGVAAGLLVILFATRTRR